MYLKNGTDHPGNKFFFAHAHHLGFGLFTGRTGNDLLENLLSLFLNARRAIDDVTAVDVHVIFHPQIHRRVGG